MINTELAKVTHTTVADQSARYPISFKYDVLPDTLAPELLVTLDGNPLTYGTDYTVDAAGLQLVNAPEANKTLMIKRDVAFTQEMDFQTGLIDPDQIEDGFDRTVMRDQELKQNVLDVAAALAAEADERITADTILQDAIDDEAEARSLADTTLQNNIDAEADAREDADDALQAAVNAKQDTIADLATIRSGAAAGATAVQPSDLATVATSGSYNDLSNKPVIPTVGAGLVTIKQGGVVKASFSVNQDTDTEVELEQGGGSGAVSSVNGKTGAVVLDASDVGAATAAQGSKADTAVQPGTLATVATSGSYNDLTNKPTIPTVGDATITIKQGGVTKGTFSVNQTNDGEINLEAGGSGGGAVDSVNGKTGVVVLNASDVGALPNTTKYGASLVLSINPSTYVLTATLKDQNGDTLGTAQTVDLPLESVVVSGAYDSATKEVVLTLQSGSVIRFSVADLVSGLQTEITALNMLDADLVDDTNSTHKFVTTGEKTTWNGKQDAISDLSSIRSGAAAGATAVQPAAITNMQTTSNLVTSVSSASTDAQYPSAKLFYETCGDIESLINAL